MLEKSPEKFIGELAISEASYKKILMWSMAHTEINFLCAGKKCKVTDVVRIRNVARAPVWFTEWNQNEYSFARRAIYGKGLKVIALGHSHPAKGSLLHPSPIDIRWRSKGRIELIAFPLDGVVKAWRIRKTVALTLKSELQLKVK
jgi:proteasome lid subunit RPN8/RPN11